jgi:CheY-like chemotaxis protein
LNSDDEAEPGQRSGRGAGSLLVHLSNDASRKTPARKPIERARYSVLVVDDNAASRYSVARNLRAGGFNTIEAATGVEALQLAPSASALVLDVQLPDIDGMEVCRLIRANPATADIPIVHMSARHQDPEDSRESSSAGAHSLLKAPVDPDVLLSVIDDLLGRRHEAGASS